MKKKKRASKKKSSLKKKALTPRNTSPKKKRVTKKLIKRRNPAAKDTQIARAQKMFAEFHGDAPMRTSKLNLSNLHAGFTIGEMLELKYSTWRDGKKINYVHSFGKRKPLLIASADGRMVLLVRNFRFSDRGFTNA